MDIAKTAEKCETNGGLGAGSTAYVWRLAGKLLLHDPIKFSVACAGVSVSVLLMLAQIGLYLGFMRNASALIDNSQADIWLTGIGNESFDSAAPMSERALDRIAALPGVERVEGVILAFGQFRLPSGGAQTVQVVGLQRNARLLVPWNVVAGDSRRIAQAGGITIDREELTKLQTFDVGERREVSGVRASVVGMTSGIRSFTTAPFIFTNIHDARAYTHLRPDQITYALVQASPGVSHAALLERLNQLPHLAAFDTGFFSARAQKYWSKRTGVGVGFFMNAAMGVLVGLVVVGQILYNATLEHYREYGTLKAMGATNGLIVRLILSQAFFSAVAGLACGGSLAVLVRLLLKHANLNVVLSPALIAGTTLLTFVMCSVAALLAISKVLRLDPSTVLAS